MNIWSQSWTKVAYIYFFSGQIDFFEYKLDEKWPELEINTILSVPDTYENSVNIVFKNRNGENKLINVMFDRYRVTYLKYWIDLPFENFQICQFLTGNIFYQGIASGFNLTSNHILVQVMHNTDNWGEFYFYYSNKVAVLAPNSEIFETFSQQII